MDRWSGEARAPPLFESGRVCVAADRCYCCLSGASLVGTGSELAHRELTDRGRNAWQPVMPVESLLYGGRIWRGVDESIVGGALERQALVDRPGTGRDVTDRAAR